MTDVSSSYFGENLVMNALHVAYGFANALDKNDLDTAAQFLSPRCEYDTGLEWLAGRDEVLQSYRSNNQIANQHLDLIHYSSKVNYVNGRTVVIQFMDDLTYNGECHQYRRNQKLTLNDEGQIVRIEHKEITGERELLYEFYHRVGLGRL